MALIFADDFKGYGTDGTLLFNGLWGSGGFSLVTDPDPLATGVVPQWNGFGNNARRPFSKGALSTAGVAARLWMASLPGFTVNQFRFLDAGNNPNTSLAVTPTGVIQIWNGPPDATHGGTLLGQTTAPVLTANAWHHVEMKVLTSGAVTTGTVGVRVNGVPVLSITGVATGVAYQLGLGTTNDYNSTAGVNAYNKDLVVWDGTGTSNNDFLGTVSVLGLVPNSDVTLGGWTLSTGTTGFSLLDNSPPVDGSQYIASAVPPTTAAQFQLTDLPTNVTSVRGLITQARAAKVDGGDGNIQSSLVSGASTANGADRPITTAFTYYEDVFEVDPATTVAWTPSGVNAVKYKINRTV